MVSQCYHKNNVSLTRAAMKLVGLDADLFSCMINYIIIEEFILDGYCTVLQFYIFHFEKKIF